MMQAEIESAASVPCGTCGRSAPYDGPTAIVLVSPRSIDFAEASRYCSKNCADAALLRYVAEVRHCDECNRAIPTLNDGVGGDRPHRGRPAIYCGEKCRKNRQVRRAKAWKIAGKGRDGLGKTTAQIEESFKLIHLLTSELDASADPELVQHLNTLKSVARHRYAEASDMAALDKRAESDQRRIDRTTAEREKARQAKAERDKRLAEAIAQQETNAT